MLNVPQLLATSASNFIAQLWDVAPVLGVMGIGIVWLALLYKDEKAERRKLMEREYASTEERHQAAMVNIDVLRGVRQTLQELVTQQEGACMGINRNIEMSTREVITKLDHMIALEAARDRNRI